MHIAIILMIQNDSLMSRLLLICTAKTKTTYLDNQNVKENDITHFFYSPVQH